MADGHIRSGDVVVATPYFTVRHKGWIAGDVSAYEVGYHVEVSGNVNNPSFGKIPPAESIMKDHQELFKWCATTMRQNGWGG